MDLMQGLLTRRSVRVYKDEKINETDMDEMIKAGMFAPSARNQQPWAFVTTNEKDVLKKISEKVETAKMAENAGFAIVVCADKAGLASPDYFMQDCSACVQNILLAAHAKGLGAVWIGMHPKNEREQAVRDVFGIPENIVVAAVIVGGALKEGLPVVDRYRPQVIHHGKW